MEPFYALVAEWSKQGLLPGSFEHAFIVRGFLAALIAGPLLGAIGTLVVTKRLTFFTQTISHASLTGVALGLVLGEPLGQTYAGLYGFSLLVAVLMLYVKNRTHASSDAVVGVVLAQVLGLGIVLLVLVTQRFDVHQVEAVLFGSLITLRDLDLAILAGTALVVTPFLLASFNRAMLVSFNPALAQARGIDTLAVEYPFVVVLTLVVVASLKVIGALLVLALIVIPAAAAQNIARSMYGFFWWSLIFGGVSALAGLAIATVWSMPTGGAIVLAASLAFYVTLVLRPLTGRGSAQQGEI